MFREQFKSHLAVFTTSPFLFVGSGISRRYIDLETWIDLLKQIHSQLRFTKPFEYYTSNANNDLPTVASLMGNEFNDTWWTSKDYEQSRISYSKNARSKFSPLKYEITRYIEEKQNIILPQFEKEITLLKKIQAGREK